MTALPNSENEVAAALREAHDYLSLTTYDRAQAYASYDRDHAVQVARWYIEEAEPAADRSPTKQAAATYQELADAIGYQFYYLTKHVGIDVLFTVSDPYTSSADMLSRVYSTGQLTVFKTPPSHHPLLSETAHDQLRAVHDLLGHCAWANSFGPKGEDAAYRSHIATLPPWTWPAICTETRVQNAMFNYGHLVDGREPFQYARQSWLPSPEWVCA